MVWRFCFKENFVRATLPIMHSIGDIFTKVLFKCTFFCFMCGKREKEEQENYIFTRFLFVQRYQ